MWKQHGLMNGFGNVQSNEVRTTLETSEHFEKILFREAYATRVTMQTLSDLEPNWANIGFGSCAARGHSHNIA